MMELDGARLRTREEAFPYLRERLALPEWFGNNLDALYDALTGENLMETYLLRLDGAEETPFFSRLRRVLEDALGERLTIVSPDCDRKEGKTKMKSWIPEGYKLSREF